MSDSLSNGIGDGGAYEGTVVGGGPHAASDGGATGGTDTVGEQDTVGEPGAAAERIAEAVGEDADPLLIRGTVRDSLGVALPRAVVTLAGATGGRQLDKTRSAQDGAFAVRAPAAGEYLLAAFSPQLGRQSVAVRLDGRAVQVEFRIDVPGTTLGD